MLWIRKITSAINFYSKCLDGRLSDADSIMAKDGSSVQKLEVLENMMNIKKAASIFKNIIKEVLNKIKRNEKITTLDISPL